MFTYQTLLQNAVITYFYVFGQAMYKYICVFENTCSRQETNIVIGYKIKFKKVM